MAPGTLFREALDSITSLGKGALILIANREHAATVIDSGFEINSEFTPQKLTELSKMDRAIVVDDNFKNILYANVLLVADSDIVSQETGTRHLAAEKVAKQIQAPVIAVSGSKERVTVYYGETRYILPDFSTLNARVNQALHILEQYRSTLDTLLWDLTSMEFERRVVAEDLASAIQLIVQMLRVEKDTKRWFVELGEEKALHQQLLEWLMLDVETRFHLILKDYQRGARKVETLIRDISRLPHDKLFETEAVLAVLGYADLDEEAVLTLVPRGYRVLHELHRLPSTVANRVVKAFGKLDCIVDASEADLMKIKGIAGVRARTIRAGMMRMEAMYNSMNQEIRHGR